MGRVLMIGDSAPEKLKCEGCGCDTSELLEDDGMNMLCRACYSLGLEDDAAESAAHQG